MSTIGRNYGCKRTKDSEPVSPVERLCKSQRVSHIKRVDLRSSCPPVFDQGRLGSCTANGALGAFQTIAQCENMSRLWLYYREREIEGNVDIDSGAQVSTGVQVLKMKGVPLESMWPYDISQFAVDPPPETDENAQLHKLASAQRVGGNLHSLKAALVSGHPIVFGFDVFQSFESQEVAQSGIVPTPNQNFEQMLGGHCMVIVGFDDSIGAGSFICRNSWGDSWGVAGYCYMGYDYLCNPQLASDFFVYQSVDIQPE